MQITATFESIEEMKDFVEAMGTGLAITTVRSAPVQTAPVQAAPVQAAPVQAAPVQIAPAAQVVPTSTPSYTPDDLAKASMTLMDSGKQGELIGLLGQFGVNALPELPPEQYGAFATALRGMGAQI